METFVNDDAYNNKFPITSGIKRRYTEAEEVQNRMCEIMERIAKEVLLSSWGFKSSALILGSVIMKPIYT